MLGPEPDLPYFCSEPAVVRTKDCGVRALREDDDVRLSASSQKSCGARGCHDVAVFCDMCTAPVGAAFFLDKGSESGGRIYANPESMCKNGRF